jgi:hypothetical protein
MKRPEKIEYAAYFENYISLAKGNDISEILSDNLQVVNLFFSAISEKNAGLNYADGKWNSKQILQHIIDTERIFSYRSLRFARNDQSELPGFDENNYAAMADTTKRFLPDLIEEFTFIRESSKYLFKNFNEEVLDRKGIASKNILSVRAAGFIIAGHSLHHINIINQRYKQLFT